MSAIVPAMRDDGEEEYRHNLLRGLAAKCQEHFDSVIVIGTARDNDSGTHMFSCQEGSLYAAIASAERWVTKQKSEWIPQTHE